MFLTEVFNFAVKLCLTLTIIFLSSIQRGWVGVEKDEKTLKIYLNFSDFEEGTEKQIHFLKIQAHDIIFIFECIVSYFRRESGCNKHNILNIMKLVDCL